MQVSFQRFRACVAVREDIPRVLPGAGGFVVAGQVPDPLAAAAGGVRAAERARRAAAPVAGARPAQRAAAARGRQPRPPGARRRHGRRLHLARAHAARDQLATGAGIGRRNRSVSHRIVLAIDDTAGGATTGRLVQTSGLYFSL